MVILNFILVINIIPNKYNLINFICIILNHTGDVFGKDQKIILTLLDIEPMMGVLEGVVMELSDCAFTLLTEVIATSKPVVAFKDVSVAFLVGAMPRRQGTDITIKDSYQTSYLFLFIFKSRNGKKRSTLSKC